MKEILICALIYSYYTTITGWVVHLSYSMFLSIPSLPGPELRESLLGSRSKRAIRPNQRLRLRLRI